MHGLLSPQVLANRDLSFDVNAGELFCLLGHNGAGKTTLIKQLTGMIPPTSGDAIVAGKFSIQKDMESVRRFGLSVCPQSSPYWEDYSVRVEFLGQEFGAGRGCRRRRGKPLHASFPVTPRQYL